MPSFLKDGIKIISNNVLKIIGLLQGREGSVFKNPKACFLLLEGRGDLFHYFLSRCTKRVVFKLKQGGKKETDGGGGGGRREK